MENEQRQDRYKKIGELETLFREMEELLKGPEAQAIERFSRPTKPIFFYSWLRSEWVNIVVSIPCLNGTVCIPY